MVLPSRTLSVSIHSPPDAVYAFASRPENLPRWSFIEKVSQTTGGWLAQTPDGAVTIRFVEENRFGVLDHFVRVAPETEVYAPMRVIANGDGAEVLFTLFRLSSMTDEQFERDAQTVQRDLEKLKCVIETLE